MTSTFPSLKGKGDIGRRAAEQVRQDDYALSLVKFFDGRTDLFFYFLHPLGLIDGDVGNPLQAAFYQFRRLNQFVSQFAMGGNQYANHDSFFLDCRYFASR